MGSACSTAVAPLHECSVCLDDISADSMCTTNCGHTFHKDCIISCMLHKDACPNCRADITALQTPRTLLKNAKEQARKRKRKEARDAKRLRQERNRRRIEREKALAAMSSAEMRVEIIRMRERGFRHGVDEDTARTNYHRRRNRRRVAAGGV